MAFRIKPNNSNEPQKTITYKIAGEIRKSQSVSTYGPGALVDFPRMSGIICGIDNWESTLGKYSFNQMKIHEKNLEAILGKRFFIQPQMTENKSFLNGITVIRFPEYCYCPECGVLDKYFKIEKETLCILL